MATIIGIDPGQNCGMAWYHGGILAALETQAPHRMLRTLWLSAAPQGFSVCFEDSRLQSHVWNADGRGKNTGALRIARNLGMVDGICAQIEALCHELKINCYAVSPQGKGSKIDAQTFCRLTGWQGKSNQHERDAAMLAWQFAKGIK